MDPWRTTRVSAWMRAHILLFLTVFGLSSCGGPTEPAILTIEYAPFLDIDVRTFTQTPSGLFYKDVVVGEGALAVSGSTVDFQVEAWLAHGTLFQPRDVIPGIRLGGGELIAGVDQALQGMRVGGRRRAIVPPNLAYGMGRVIVFDLDLQAVR